MRQGWMCAGVMMAVFSSVAVAARRGETPPSLESVAAILMGQALTSDEAHDELVELCDTFGHRLTGSAALEAAIDWTLVQMDADGLETSAQEVPVQIWSRGEESLAMLQPMERSLSMLGLGWSVGTPPEGIEAEVVVVDDFEHLEALGAAAVEGRIVLFDVPFTTYGQTVAYRLKGASAAARLGAVAALVRSVSPEGLYTPHTGTLAYAEDAPAIPAAAITIEDATWIRRLSQRGETVRLRLTMGAQDLGAGTSRNAIGEIRGREKPDEVVVLGCHIDSWDVGQGAQDDGAGCMAAMEAGRLIAALPVPPRRTVRVVLYTNEENGMAGGKTYAEQLTDTPIAAIESDTGMGLPSGFRVDVRGADEQAVERRRSAVLAQLQPVSELLRPLGSDGLRPGFSGADIGPTVALGAIGLGVDHDTSTYWPIHHTPADTVEKVDPDKLRVTAASMAVMGYALAELDLPE